ncbi:MAG TPA: ABC transporter ATP-binding protein [Steroidobacteraceae bacterium]|nr:ABC transporter ATP-binding protein [Steroidobacteraceae bacterium]
MSALLMPSTNLVEPAPLACAGVSKRFDGSTILSRLDLQIPAGAVLGLIGRNGAGKTTLIRILMGLLAPDAGTATVLGEPALLMSDAAKTCLGYVPQTPDALKWMRVGEMLDFIGRFYPRWDPDYVADSLLRWTISPEKPLAKLSPGERQRVALIRALALRPRLLVLDEPAASLDPVARRDLLREIALRAGESGTTVLFSTHIVSDLERVASHVAFLHEGSLVLKAPMDDLKETHTRLWLPPAGAAQLTGKLPGELRRRQLPDGALSIVLAREAGAAWPAATALPGADMEVLGLEDLFVEITRGFQPDFAVGRQRLRL